MNNKKFSRALNPAFAAAHGLAVEDRDDAAKTTTSSRQGNRNAVSNSSSVTGSNRRLEHVLKQAAGTGKLLASNLGLSHPLPDECFHFPFHHQSNGGFTEELMQVVDFSDNNYALDDTAPPLDERVLRFLSVASMRFRNCGLGSVSINLSSLDHLTILDLSGNKLNAFDLSQMPKSLQELNLSKNVLKQITIGDGDGLSTILRLDALQVLDLSENDLESLESLDDLQCKTLRIFRCHHNRNLQRLPQFLHSASNSLEILEFSHNPKIFNGTEQIDLSAFVKLQTVDLSFCKLSIVPCVSCSVIRLDLDSNKIASLSGLFSDGPGSSSSQLVDLFLGDNNLIELDAEIVRRLPVLKRLDLRTNKLRSLPYQLGFLSNIKSLELSGNPLTTKFRSSELNNPIALLHTLRKRAPKDEQDTGAGTLGRATGQSGSPALLMSALTKGNNTLDFAGKFSAETATAKLQCIVDELRASPTIAHSITGQLLLDSNHLQSLPDELLPLLPNLDELSIAKNALKGLPKDMLESNAKLKRIRLSRNLLTTECVGASLGLFSQTRSSQTSMKFSLVHLDLSANRIESFPADITSTSFPHLEHLNLSSNRIRSVHDWKRLPASLTFLDLSENSIQDMAPLVPLLASDCPNLQHLSLMHNSLTHIPASLGLLQEYCPRLVTLNIKGNPQRGIPTHVQDYDCSRLATYLMNRLTPEQRADAIRGIEARNNLDRDDGDIGVECVLVVEGKKEEEKEEKEQETVNESPPASDRETTEATAQQKETPSELVQELEEKIADLEEQLENLSLSQAKRYALKKSLAMERSKLIREKRRLQWTS